jgi:MFS transporter, DHA3 family, macrolide efflux protein
LPLEKEMNLITGNSNDTDTRQQGWKRRAALFLSSQGASLFGSMLVQYAIIWHVTLRTQSGSVLTIAMLAGFLPQIAVSLFAGVWADRYPRKLLIIGSDTLTAVSTLILAVVFLLGYQELWLIYLLSAIRAIGAGIQSPAVNALLPQIVPGDKLLRVNSINSTLQPFIMITAPIAAGALLSVSRLESIFMVDVVTAAVAVSLLLALRVAPLENVTAKAGYLDDFREGYRYIRRNRAITTLFVFFGLVWFLVVPAAFLSPLLVARSYGEEVWKLTANEVTFFGGSILGGVIMTAWGGFKNRFRTIALTCIIWAGLFAALGLARNFTLYLVLMILSGVPMPFMNVSTTTLLQEMVRADMQGRVFSLQQLIVSSVMPLGLLVFGPLADVVSVEMLLVAASGFMAVPGVWLYLSKHGGSPGPRDDETKVHAVPNRALRSSQEAAD